jgi:dTDP-4-amino-4,6-dideoxygalactose transaminase
MSDIFNGFAGLAQSSKNLDYLDATIREEFHVDYAFFVSSGKAAITLTLQVLAKMHPERKFLIVPAFNCYSVPSAIFRAGLSVLPCDIDPKTLAFNADELKILLERYTGQVLAVFATHFWGLPFDTTALRTQIKDSSIYIIDDAAQAMGSVLNYQHVGTLGDVGIFSLSRGKALSAGEGGIIITNNTTIARELKPIIESLPAYTTSQIIKLIITNIILSICISPWIFWLPKMLPFLKLGETLFEPDFPIQKLSSFQAGLLKNWRQKIRWLHTERQARVEQYNENITSDDHIFLLTKYSREKKLFCIRYPILITNKDIRDKLLEESDQKGLGLSAAYPDTINSIKEINVPDDLLDNKSRFIVDHILTLPCHPLVTRNDIEKIVEMVKRGKEKMKDNRNGKL